MPQQYSIPRFRPVIRVFVSSTFSDLKPERNALQAQVFPRLEQLCAQNGFQFQAIDLRWGVSSEVGLNRRTMRICFDELRRAQEISPRPNFLILLGNRYGWRPLPEEISVAEFEALERVAAQLATTTDQPAAGVLHAWYRRDENAVPPVYLLQSRRQQLPDARDYTQDAPWNEVQTILWEIINRAQPPEELRGRFDVAVPADDSPPNIVRFQASATEQEIWQGALRVSDAREHVLAFFRQIENVAEFSEPAPLKDFLDLEMSGKVDEFLWNEQERLKEALKPRLGEKNVFAGSARLVPLRDVQGRPTVDVTTDHLAQLCADVEGRLTQIIRGQIDEYWNRSAPASPERSARELKIEQDEHQRFGRERGGEMSFVGRQAELQAIRDYLQNDSRWPLVVHGASGCGKTALLARAAEETQKSEISGRMPQVIVRFIGVTPRSSDIRSLLGSLCQELRLRHPREGELPTETKALGEELQEHFKFATPEQPLILFLDALDQLSDADSGRLLNWIPTGPLPGNVKLVASCLSDRAKDDPADQPFIELTRRHLPAANIINLDALSEEEASTLLFDRWLPQAGRTISRDQRERIAQRLKSEECRQPIYLKLLFEEARLWHSYDAAPSLGESVPAILGQLIKRLSLPANHGPLLVERVLGYLAASRHGLAENEILEVLFADPEYKAALDQATEQTRHELPASATRIPIAIWSRLRFDLAPYLTERAAPGANVLTFYHRQVAEWVQEHFVKASDYSWQPHRRLADYFTARAKGTAVEWETDSVRGFAECVYQLIKTGQHEQPAGLLSNFPFLLHKLRVGLLEGVFEDYEMFRNTAPANVVLQLDIWSAFFREKAHILRRGNEEWPAHKILLQLAVEHADESPLTIGATQWLEQDRCEWVWFRRTQRISTTRKSNCLSVLEGHTGAVSGALELADGRLLSWSADDKTLLIWDDKTGARLVTLAGHTDGVKGAIALRDGRVVSWSTDTTLRLWDSRTGVCLAIQELPFRNLFLSAVELPEIRLLSWSDKGLGLWDLHTVKFKEISYGLINAVVLANEQQLICCASDGELQFWDATNMACQATIQAHVKLSPSKSCFGLTPMANARLVSWGDTTLRIWDWNSRLCVRTLEGHSKMVLGALVLNDGRLLSWSEDKSLRLWNPNSGECVAVLEGHTADVRGAVELPDGRLVSWGDSSGASGFASDYALHFWDSRTGACIRIVAAHASGIGGVCRLLDGTLLSWSHCRWTSSLQEHTLRFWDCHTGTCIGLLDGHTDAIEGALQLPDGSILSWSEDKTLRRWSCRGGDRRTNLDGHNRGVRGALRLDKLRLLSWSWDNTLRLWDVTTGSCLAVLSGHTMWVDGALDFVDGRLLSWSGDKTLRLWDGRVGKCLAVLEGHTGSVDGSLVLGDGRLLSWSEDGTLRIWDSQSGACLAVLEGHTSNVCCALVLPNGKLLSWSDFQDTSLRLWNPKDGSCLAVLEGHTEAIAGALALRSGGVLSWEGGWGYVDEWDALAEPTLRLWDDQHGTCRAILRGHKGFINGALQLADGRVLSWGDYGELRIWDARSGECLMILEGHDSQVRGVSEMKDGRLLSWDKNTFRLWDCDHGTCLEDVPTRNIDRVRPGWAYSRIAVKSKPCLAGGFYADCSGRSTRLHNLSVPSSVFRWEADEDVEVHSLFPSGGVVVILPSGQVYFPQLYKGQRRISLTEVEEVLASQMKLVK